MMKTKKGMRIFVFICVGLITVGILFSGLGFIMGGVPNLPNLSYVYTGEYGDKDFWKGDKEIERKTVENFKNVQIYAGASDVNFIESDKYEVEYCYSLDIGAPEVTVENGTLVYRDRLYKSRDWMNLDFKKIFYPCDTLYVNVYYPAGVTLDTTDITVDVVTVDLGSLHTATLNMDIGVGDITGNGVFADYGDLNVGVGDIDIKNVTFKGLSSRVDVGEIEIAGELRGETSAKCAVGDIVLRTTLSKKEYQFDLDSGVGDVDIDGGTSEKNPDAQNSLEAETDVGDITIKFQ